MWKLLLMVVWNGVLATAAHSKPASAYFNICHKKVPDFSQCVINTITALTPSLIKGIPEIGLVPIDPLHIPRMETTIKEGALQFVGSYTNVTVYGIGNFKMQSFSMDLDNLIIYMNTTIPFMRFTSIYDIQGKIILLPVKGHGDGDFNFTNVFVAGEMKGKLETRNGEEYLIIKDINYNTDISDAHVQLNNLFNGDKLLGDATNKVFNENWREIYVTYKHLVEEALGTVFRDLSNRVFNKFPFKELYPD